MTDEAVFAVLVIAAFGIHGAFYRQRFEWVLLLGDLAARFGVYLGLGLMAVIFIVAVLKAIGL